jgi:hypothetical protein
VPKLTENNIIINCGSEKYVLSSVATCLNLNLSITGNSNTNISCEW